MNNLCKNNFNSTHSTKRSPEEITVNVTELILTPLTCASVINEIIKCLVYQKSQVPYSHNWLKSVVSRKRNNSENGAKSINFTAEQHYHVVSTAYDALENIMHNVHTEFKTHGNDIRQVLVLFGSTLYSPKEAYTIRVANLAKGHSEENHLHINSKNQYKILRNIVLAQEWMHAMESSIPPTNMYVLLQKHLKHNQGTEARFFSPNKQYSFPLRTKNIVINLNYDDHMPHNCCENLLIFEDLPKDNNLTNISDNGSEDSENQVDDLDINCDNYSNCDLLWFQANVVLKGFKECFIKNVSATEMW